MIPLVSLIIIIAISLLVTRIAAIILAHTGLSWSSARFQARSAFTGAGFTTTEAESVVNHPLRRKIIMTLMLLGNAGVVSAIASLLLTFVKEPEGDGLNAYEKVGILLGSVGLLYLISKSHWLDARIRSLVKRLLQRFTTLKVRDYAGLLGLADDYEISVIQVSKYNWLADKDLRKLKLREEGINVLAINRSDGDFIGSPLPETSIKEGDEMIIYGHQEDIQELTSRKHGSFGNAQHQEAVKEHKEEVEEQKKQEEFEESLSEKKDSSNEGK